MLSKTDFKGLPIFITSMSRWDGDTSSASLALAKVLSRTNPVYYIDFPYSYTDFWRERNQPAVKQRVPALLWGKNSLKPIEGDGQKIIGATPKLVFPFYSMAPGPLFAMASHHNNKIVARLIKKIIRKNGFRNYILLNSFNPSYLAAVQDYLQPTLSIYQSRDAIEETHIHSIVREDNCVRNYDLTIATSKQICRNIENRTGKKAACLPNGGDTQLFRSAQEKGIKKPVELEGIKTPIIGYTGAVCQRIDYELVVKIAETNTDKTIVFVGPRRDKQHTQIDLDAIPNIVFTGAKKLDELPAYLRYFDCAIIPFRYNKLTAGIYPLKVNEYLAAGKAVVTTNFSEDIASFRNHVYLADSHADFLQMIKEAVKDNKEETQKQRAIAASGNAWEKRVDQFWELAWNSYHQKAALKSIDKDIITA